MKKVCVVTATRAEYGLLYSLIKKLNSDKEFDFQLVVTGTHLCEQFGYTVREIENDGFRIVERVPIIDAGDSTSVIFSKAAAGFEKCFNSIKPDAVILLGDRFEILAVASVCLFKQIPIVHISGGDSTFGAIDEACRHAVTKMACLHFVGNPQHRKRVIQLGENPETVFDVGEPGIENIVNSKHMTKAELSDSIGFDLSGDFSVVTYHPVTSEKGSEKKQINEVLEALSRFERMNFIITKANADSGGTDINNQIEEFTKDKSNFFFISSLGFKRYLSALKYAKAVIGNSSSGIVEAPLFHIPTVNIGNRQEGRLQSDSVINCEAEASEIEKALKLALSESHAEKCKSCKNLYGDGRTSEKIIRILHDFIDNGKLVTKKKFYDIDFTVK